MAHPTLTALPLPAVSTFPSERCIQWSEDGQAILLTRQAVFILTPELGISVESSFVVKQSLDKKAHANSQRQVGWLRTMIEWDRSSEAHQWAIECQDWGAVSLGSLDLSLVAVTCSPSNVTTDAGCVFAVLDSNMEAFLYRAEKNYLTGKWQKVGALLSILDAAAEVDEEEPNSKLLRAMSRQITSIAWSPQAGFAAYANFKVDASLLAVGTNAGTVNLLRYEPGDETTMTLVGTIEVQERRITHLAWTSWQSTAQGEVHASLACAVADGSIAIIQVSQSLTPSASSLEFGISVSHELNDQACEPTRRSTGAVRWIDMPAPGSGPALVFSKPGLIHIWRTDDSAALWRGLRSIEIKTQKFSVGSTALAPVSGIAHIRRRDAIVVSLSDGSFHVIQGISTEPRLVPQAGSADLSSQALSAAARQHFVSVEEEAMRKVDVNCTHGMTTFDGDSFFVWIHEALRPTDFNYKHDAKHTNMVVMAQLWGGERNEVFLQDVEGTLNLQNTSGETPQALLRHIYLRLHDPDTLLGLSPQILEILNRPPSADGSIQLDGQPWDGDLNENFRRHLRESLRSHLFGSPSLLRLRRRVALSTFCEKHCRDQTQRDAFRLATANMAHIIWAQILSILVRHLLAVAHVLSPIDAVFIWRIAVRAMLPGNTSEVKAEAEALAAEVHKLVPTPENAPGANLDLDELCPACHARVPPSDINSAVCPNGHYWARCSITSFLLSTPMVRTCAGCSRKAFLPSRPDSPASSWLPRAAQTWLVEDLLRTVRRCFFCGSNFVTLI